MCVCVHPLESEGACWLFAAKWGMFGNLLTQGAGCSCKYQRHSLSTFIPSVCGVVESITTVQKQLFQHSHSSQSSGDGSHDRRRNNLDCFVASCALTKFRTTWGHASRGFCSTSTTNGRPIRTILTFWTTSPNHCRQATVSGRL